MKPSATHPLSLKLILFQVLFYTMDQGPNFLLSSWQSTSRWDDPCANRNCRYAFSRLTCTRLPSLWMDGWKQSCTCLLASSCRAKRLNLVNTSSCFLLTTLSGQAAVFCQKCMFKYCDILLMRFLYHIYHPTSQTCHIVRVPYIHTTSPVDNAS